MNLYKITEKQLCVIEYEYFVIAESEEEAKEKMFNDDVEENKMYIEEIKEREIQKTEILEENI